MSISEHFRYRKDVFQYDIFVHDIGITDVDVGCWISPTLRSMLMPTYACDLFIAVPCKREEGRNGWSSLLPPPSQVWEGRVQGDGQGENLLWRRGGFFPHDIYQLILPLYIL
jgi:hypothetical protein